MKFGKFELFPKEKPEIKDCQALFIYLPFTGAHLYYMGFRRRTLTRLLLLFVIVSTPFIPRVPMVLIQNWIYAFFILVLVWIYDALTLKVLFETKFGRSVSYRI